MTRFDPTAPYEVAEEDVPYGGPADARLLARVYRPAGVAGPWPALVDVHGGAWAYFDRTADAHFDRALAACGMVVVALDFRQAPIRYPACRGRHRGRDPLREGEHGASRRDARAGRNRRRLERRRRRAIPSSCPSG